jgi:hypothetical protein
LPFSGAAPFAQRKRSLRVKKSQGASFFVAQGALAARARSATLNMMSRAALGHFVTPASCRLLLSLKNALDRLHNLPRGNPKRIQQLLRLARVRHAVHRQAPNRR